jgi:large subunit ribosomal protein L25
MARSVHAALAAASRPVEGSRSTRRLRREGLVPGIVYGGGDEPETFAVDARILRNTLAHSGAVLELSIDGATATPVIVKDVQNHPVRGQAIHVDLLRVRMDQPIHAVVVLDLTGGNEAPGVTEGGVLSQGIRELNIMALPDNIPNSIVHDVSDLEMNATVMLSAVSVPEGVRLLDDPDETVIATITPPTLEPVEDEIETETELVGEDGTPVEAAEGDEAQADGRGEAGDGGRRPEAGGDEASSQASDDS